MNKYQCHLCDFDTFSLQFINDHITRRHTDEEIRKYRTLNSTNMLYSREYESDILEITDFKCKKCTHISSTKEDFYKHVISEIKKMKICRKHNGFHCWYCPKCSHSKFALRVHIRRHLRYTTFECENCLNTFVCRSDLNKHIRRFRHDHPPIHQIHSDAIPSDNLTQELNDHSSNNTISNGARDNDHEDSVLYKKSMQLSDIQRKNMTFEQRVESYLENISRDYISLKTTILQLKSAINEVRRNQILVLNTVQNEAGGFGRGIMDETMRDDLNSEVNYHENTIASSSNFWQMPSGRDSSGGTDPCCSNEPSGTNLLSLIDGRGLRNDMESNDQVYGSSTRATSNVENSRSTVTQQCFSRFIKEEIDDRPGDTEISQIHQSLLIPHSSTISDTSSGSGVDIKDVITRAMPTDLPKPRTYQYFDHDCNELRMTDEWKEYALSLYPVQPKRFWNIAPSDFDRLIPDEILENGEETKRELIKSIREWFYSQYRIAQLHFVLKENPNYVNKDLTWIWQAYKQTMEKKNWPIYGTELLPNEVSSAELQLNEPFFY